MQIEDPGCWNGRYFYGIVLFAGVFYAENRLWGKKERLANYKRDGYE